MQNEIESKIKEIITLMLICSPSNNATALELCFEILKLLGESNATTKPEAE